jgi:phosphoacetylglucosamine mutase
MITASHNPVRDNGVKLVEASGAMLALEWERHAEALAKCATEEELVAAVRGVVEAEGIPLGKGAFDPDFFCSCPAPPPTLFPSRRIPF